MLRTPIRRRPGLDGGLM